MPSPDAGLPGCDCVNDPRHPICKATDDGSPAPLNSCVECLANDDCPSPNAPHCVANQCEPCGSNDDCRHVMTGGFVLGVCDTSAATPTCVECSGPQRAGCGTRVCDSIAKRCANVAVGSAGQCASCIADDQCTAGNKCALQVFQGTQVGYFCVPEAQDSTPCSQPFFGLANAVTTIDGSVANLCLLRRTTCPAILQSFFTTCSTASDCGVADLDDGLCNSSGQCTTPCTTAADCAGGTCSLSTSACQD